LRPSDSKSKLTNFLALSQEEVERFFGKSFGEVATGIELANLLGEEFPLEKYPLIHQIIAEG